MQEGRIRADRRYCVMEKRPHYEYDAEMQVLVKIPAYRGLPTVISRRDPHWGDLGPEYESYARAIYLGQGCWERLETISEEKAQEILKEWGCPPE